MNVKEVANLTGISVRALHHYDRMGLLCPRRNRENDYREYSESDLDRLQQILFFKECGFSLQRIRALLNSPSFDREKAFELQRKYLLHEKRRIETMLGTLERTIESQKGVNIMTQKEKFDGFDFSKNPYEEEARRLWGNETVERSNAFLESKSGEEREVMAKTMDELFKELAAIRKEAPDSEVAQRAIDRMYRLFNESFGYHYTLDVFAGIGKMYVDDERFTRNIDKYGEGLSVFLSNAMRIYAERGESAQ